MIFLNVKNFELEKKYVLRNFCEKSISRQNCLTFHGDRVKANIENIV